MSSRPMLGWTVPKTEWDRFVNYVEYVHGEIEGYVGREVERAMAEYAEDDEYAAVEDLVDRLVQAAGRNAATMEKKKKNS